MMEDLSGLLVGWSTIRSIEYDRSYLLRRELYERSC